MTGKILQILLSNYAALCFQCHPMADWHTDYIILLSHLGDLASWGKLSLSLSNSFKKQTGKRREIKCSEWIFPKMVLAGTRWLRSP